MKKKEIKFIFDNEKTAMHFISWLCESGEQDYWQWMEAREEEEKGDITVIDFDYWSETKSGKKFGQSDIICKSGRLDDSKSDRDDQ